MRVGDVAENTSEDRGAAAQEKLVSPELFEVLTDQGQVGLVPSTEEFPENIRLMDRESFPGQTELISSRHDCQAVRQVVDNIPGRATSTYNKEANYQKEIFTMNKLLGRL